MKIVLKSNKNKKQNSSLFNLPSAYQVRANILITIELKIAFLRQIVLIKKLKLKRH